MLLFLFYTAEFQNYISHSKIPFLKISNNYNFEMNHNITSFHEIYDSHFHFENHFIYFYTLHSLWVHYLKRSYYAFFQSLDIIFRLY